MSFLRSKSNLWDVCIGFCIEGSSGYLLFSHTRSMVDTPENHTRYMLQTNLRRLWRRSRHHISHRLDQSNPSKACVLRGHGWLRARSGCEIRRLGRRWLAWWRTQGGGGGGGGGGDGERWRVPFNGKNEGCCFRFRFEVSLMYL